MTELSWKQPFIRTVEQVLTPAECAELISRIEALGPSDAPITTPRGVQMRPDIRNNTRVMFDDLALAASLFAKVRGAIPDELEGMSPLSGTSGTGRRCASGATASSWTARR